MQNHKKELIALVESNNSMAGYEKTKLITSILNGEIGAQDKETTLEIEKYRIDKMLEAGLVKDKTFTEVRKDKIIDDVMHVFKSAKFYYVLISILTFTTIIFNSSNYWKYQNKELDYQNKGVK